MSRIALLGEGPLPGPGAVDTAFAQLRLHQLFAALREENEVHVVDTRSDDVGVALRELRPTCVVTAGTFGPTRAAVAAVGFPESSAAVAAAGFPESPASRVAVGVPEPPASSAAAGFPEAPASSVAVGVLGSSAARASNGTAKVEIPQTRAKSG